jgi:hypothetical protein
MNEYTKQVLHLTRMAMLPGFIDHSRFRCKELEKEPMFQGIGKDVAKELGQAQAAASRTLATTEE